MNIDVSRPSHSFPQPDFEAIGNHRSVVAQYAGAQGAGSLRDQLLTVLERVYVVDVEIITMLDGVCGSLRGIDMEPYRAAMQELEREGRTQQENLALLAYQEQAVNELLGGLRNARAYLDTLNQHLLSVEKAIISDTRELAGYAELLLKGISAFSEESHRRTLEFLVEDMKGPPRVDEARRGYVEEINKLLSPVEFFCHSVSAPGQAGIQRLDDFQHHATELMEYLQRLRRNWRS
jgi:hypothetical protein